MAAAQADQLPEGVERIRAPNPGPLTLSGTNTYLVGSPAWVIDPGPDDDAHLERVWSRAEARGGVAGIALTHRHLDHAAAAPLLRERSGAQLAAGRATATGGAFDEPGIEALEVDALLAEGVEFGPLRTLETPGHSSDHLAFVWGDVLFCGDTVLGEGSVFIPPGGGSLRAYLDSLERLEALELSALCPGHGPVVDRPREKLREYIEHRLERERRLLDALGRGLRTRDELLDDVWDDAPAVLRPAAALTLEAHLDKLEGDGMLPAGVERLERA